MRRMISRWARTTFSALGDPHYRVLWIGTSLSFLAFAMSNVVQSVVAYDLTGKNGDVGKVALGMGIATIVTAPFGGVIADRVSKRGLLLVGQTTIAADFTLVGVLIITDHITIPLLVASTFVMGLVFSFIAPARQAWIGELLQGPRLPNGIALQQVAMTSTRIVGPFLAGALVALPFIASGGTYVFMGALLAIVVATLAQLPPSRPRQTAEGHSALADFREGLEHVAARPSLTLLAVSFIGIVIAGYSYQVVLPGYLSGELGRSSKDVAWLLGVAGFAGLIVTVGVAGMAGSRHAWRLMSLGGVVLGVALIGLALAGNFVIALFVMLFVGAGSSSYQLLNSALLVQESDPAYYGRVMSLTMLAWGFNGLAGLPFGLLADATGERPALFVMGVAVLSITAASTAARRVIGPTPVTRPALGADRARTHP